MSFPLRPGNHATTSHEQAALVMSQTERISW